jgi:hypothetical protein
VQGAYDIGMSYALYGSNMSNATEGGRFVNNEGSDLTLK